MTEYMQVVVNDGSKEKEWENSEYSYTRIYIIPLYVSLVWIHTIWLSRVLRQSACARDCVILNEEEKGEKEEKKRRWPWKRIDVKQVRDVSRKLNHLRVIIGSRSNRTSFVDFWDWGSIERKILRQNRKKTFNHYAGPSLASSHFVYMPEWAYSRLIK